jgi:hypothetical protein
MNAIIVGHGPSILYAKKGEVIDKYDAVIRLKWGWKGAKDLTTDSGNPAEDFGMRTDYLLSTLRTVEMYERVTGLKEYWGYDNVFCGRNLFKIQQAMEPTPVWVDYPTTKYWLEMYNSMRTWGLPHVSTGMAAIWYACTRLKLKSLTIVGYDNTIAGTGLDYKSVWRPDEYKYPAHRWDIEHTLLPLITSKYGVKLCVL